MLGIVLFTASLALQTHVDVPCFADKGREAACTGVSYSSLQDVNKKRVMTALFSVYAPILNKVCFSANQRENAQEETRMQRIFSNFLEEHQNLRSKCGLDKVDPWTIPFCKEKMAWLKQENAQLATRVQAIEEEKIEEKFLSFLEEHQNLRSRCGLDLLIIQDPLIVSFCEEKIARLELENVELATRAQAIEKAEDVWFQAVEENRDWREALGIAGMPYTFPQKKSELGRDVEDIYKAIEGLRQDNKELKFLCLLEKHQNLRSQCGFVKLAMHGPLTVSFYEEKIAWLEKENAALVTRIQAIEGAKNVWLQTVMENKDLRGQLDIPSVSPTLPQPKPELEKTIEDIRKATEELKQDSYKLKGIKRLRLEEHIRCSRLNPPLLPTSLKTATTNESLTTVSGIESPAFSRPFSPIEWEISVKRSTESHQ